MSMIEFLVTKERVTSLCPPAVRRTAAYLLGSQLKERGHRPELAVGLLAGAIRQQRVWREHHGFSPTPFGDFICAGLIIANSRAVEAGVEPPIQLSSHLVELGVELPEQAVLYTADLVLRTTQNSDLSAA